MWFFSISKFLAHVANANNTTSGGNVSFHLADCRIIIKVSRLYEKL